MMTGPPRVRPWPEGEPQTIGNNGVRLLTVPEAYALWARSVGYHLPLKLHNAERLSLALRWVR